MLIGQGSDPSQIRVGQSSQEDNCSRLFKHLPMYSCIVAHRCARQIN